MSVPHFLKIDEAADRFNISQAGLRKLLKEVVIEYVKFGNHRQLRVRITNQEIERFLNENTISRKVN